MNMIVKVGKKYENKGKAGAHGKMSYDKARAQQKAIFASGWKTTVKKSRSKAEVTGKK